MTSLHGGSGGIVGTTTSEPTTTQSTMATGFTLTLPPALKIHDGNVAEKWKKFCLAWSSYALATELKKKSEPVQVAALLTVIGEDARDVYSTFDCDDEANKSKIELVLQQFANYCQPLSSVIVLISGLKKQARATTSTKQHLENLLKAVSSTLSHPRRYCVTV